MNIPTTLAMCLLTLAATPVLAQTEFFSIDPNQMQQHQAEQGRDLIYYDPGTTDQLANYRAVMVDQPEVQIAADSKYKGLKPEDFAAIAGMVREAMMTELAEGGYAVVEQPGPGVLYMRTAVADLYIKKDKRGVMSFTPVGLVVTAGKSAMTETLNKIDIIEMSLAAELADSQTGEVLAAALLQRGQQKAKGQKETRMEVDELVAEAQEYSERFRCRLDNSRHTAEERIDCADAEARKASGM